MATFSGSSVWHRPTTRLGQWAVGLMVTFIILFILNSAVMMNLPENLRWQPALIAYGFAMLLCGFAAGVAGLIAVIKRNERSWLVWVTVLPMVFVLFLVIGEFVGALLGFGH